VPVQGKDTQVTENCMNCGAAPCTCGHAVYPEKPTQSILAEAEGLVDGPRAKAYGDAQDTYEHALKMYEAWHGSRTIDNAAQCTMFFHFVKLARDRAAPKRDNRVDSAGYLYLFDKLSPAPGSANPVGSWVAGCVCCGCQTVKKLDNGALVCPHCGTTDPPTEVFHGGCVRCSSQAIHGIERCKGCQYHQPDWSKPDLGIRPESA